MQPPLCGVGVSPGHTGCAWLVGTTPTRTSVKQWECTGNLCLETLEIWARGSGDWKWLKSSTGQGCCCVTASMQMMEIKCSWISRYKGPGPALQEVQVAQENMLWTQEWPAHSSITACPVSEAVWANKEQIFSPRHLNFLPVWCSWWVKISLWCGSWYPDSLTFATSSCALALCF